MKITNHYPMKILRLFVTAKALLFIAIPAIISCGNGKQRVESDNPEDELIVMSEDDTKKSEVRYMMLHLKNFSFDERENGTFKVEDMMKNTKYKKIFENVKYFDNVGSIVTESERTLGYAFHMKQSEDQNSMEPDDKYFTGIIWHIRPGKTFIEYIFDSDEPRQEFLQEAMVEGFTQVNDSSYSKEKPNMSCINLSKYKGLPSLKLICY